MSQLHILECNLRKVGKMTWSNFIFVSEKKEPCCGFMNLNGFFFDWTSISLLQCQGKWLPNGKNKKEKKWKRKSWWVKKRTILWLDRAKEVFFFIVMFLFCRTRKIEIDIFWHVDHEMILTEFLAIFSDFKAIYTLHQVPIYFFHP